MLANPDVALKAIYSRSLASAKSAAESHAVDLYSDDSQPLDALLARDDISAVIIALPITAQPAVITKALAAGKHVLAEKPIAKDVASAKALIAESASHTATLSIAENFRFVPRFEYAASQVAQLGRLTHFSVTIMSMMKTDNPYYGTSWRTTPAYQGGFLLDGGVHNAAATRMVLSAAGDAAKEVAAFTSLAQQHLPPIDSVSATVRTQKGAIGTYQHSAGTRMASFDFHFACDGGSVRSDGDVVTVKKGDDVTTKEFEATSGVKEELAAWVAQLRGKQDSRLSAKEALGDVEFLEAMFNGGQTGAVQTYSNQ